MTSNTGQIIPSLNFPEMGMDISLFWEQRMEYSGDNLLYIGYNQTANASVDSASWYILKFSYSGDNVIRKELPAAGAAFKYAWSNRTSYFS